MPEITTEVTLARVDELLARMGEYDLQLAMTYKLSPGLAGVLNILLHESIVIPDEIPRSRRTTPYKQVSRLREFLKGTGIIIHSHYGVGYWLDAATKSRIRADMALLLGDSDDATSVPQFASQG
jgi:hypothetical protein